MLSIGDDKISNFSLDNIINHPHKLFEADVIIIEGISVDSTHKLTAEGYRTGKELLLADKKVLILFSLPENFIPQEGPFWLNILCSKKTLKQKIQEILYLEVLEESVLKDYFEKLESQFPFLKKAPSHHAHH